MASACDGITLVSVKDENGDIWDGLNDFGTLDCCLPRTLEFVFKNDWAQSIRIDNLEDGNPCGEADILDDGAQGYTVSQVSGVTQGEIGAGEFFSVFVTVDPAAANCNVIGPITGTLQIYGIEVGGAGGCCTFLQDFSATLISKRALNIDLGVQGNNDGYLQMTQTVGGSLSKGIILTNPGSQARDYTFLEPGCWAGRFTSSFDMFSLFTLAAGASQAVNITYTPTVEELDCCPLEGEDDCGAPLSFTLCFEATITDPVDPPPPPPDPDPPGGTPPCQSLIDCRIADQGIEQLIRKSIVVDDDGCPAIRIILT